MGIVGGEGEIDGSALRIKAQMHRDGLDQCGLADAVFSHKKGYPLGDGEPLHLPQMPDHRQTAQPALRGGSPSPIPMDVRKRSLNMMPPPFSDGAIIAQELSGA